MSAVSHLATYCMPFPAHGQVANQLAWHTSPAYRPQLCGTIGSLICLAAIPRFPRSVGRSNSAISRWRINGIPPAYWPLMLDLADARGLDDITIEELRAGLPRDSRYRVGKRLARPVA